MRKRMLGMAAAALAVAGGAAVVTPTAASASVVGRCSGSVAADGTRTIYDRPGTTPIGRVELWYSSANGGTNCVMIWNYLGYKASLTPTLWLDDGRSQSAPGSFVTYSNGAQLTGTNGKCARFSGSIAGSGPIDRGSASRGWGNCG
jgi:hypothetical protein